MRIVILYILARHNAGKHSCLFIDTVLKLFVDIYKTKMVFSRCACINAMPRLIHSLIGETWILAAICVGFGCAHNSSVTWVDKH